MRVLFVLENYFPHLGGAEIVFKNLAEGLAKRGFSVDIITHRLKNTKSFEVINGVKVHRVACFDSRYLFTFFAVPKVLRIAKKADVIHTTTFNGAPPAWLASRLLGKPCVLTVHEVWVGRWRRATDLNFLSAFIHDALERMIYLLPFEKYACVSESTKNNLFNIGVKLQKIEVVYNGIDYEHFNHSTYDRKFIRKKLKFDKHFVILIYGRPGASKGIEYAVGAVEKVVNAIPSAKFVFILSRDKSYRKRYDAIKNILKKKKLGEAVVINDPVPWKDLPERILASDCVVIPSIAEGFGFSAAESCAMGRPVVVTSAGSLPEVVSGKFVVVPPKSSGAIAKGIIDVYNKRYNPSKPKKFLISENVRDYISIYSSFLNSRKRLL